MTRITLLTTAAALAASTAIAASHQSFGAHFIEQWDDDADGQVTLAEAQDKREGIFTMFDIDENDVLDAEEYTAFDTHRVEDARMHAEDAGMGQGNGQGHGMGNGNGRQAGNGAGQGKGHGNGMGQGMGTGEPGFMRVHAAMDRAFNDADADGTVTRAEFVGATPKWFETMDRSGDGVLTSDDFGPDRG